MPTAVRWTEEELNQLKSLAKDFCMSDVAEMLHRPQTSVRVKANQLGVTFARHEDANYKKPKKSSKTTDSIRRCYKCKDKNDRLPPATVCSKCFVGPKKPKGTGWASRRCLNCNQGYTGKTRDFCQKDCKSEFATKERMKTLKSLNSLKKCIKCNESKNIWLFNLDSSRKDKVHPYCRVCQKDNKLLTADNARNRRLLNFYGITLEEYESLLKFQNGHCAMCPAIPTERSLAVDHDHISGAIRGLLCLTCNKYKLGQLTIEDVDKIYEYLHNPPADQHFGEKKNVPVGMEKPKRRRKRKIRER